MQYKKIKLIGGNTVQKMISNILTTCITFEVGHKLSWTGAKNTVAIENSTFANTIIGKCTLIKDYLCFSIFIYLHYFVIYILCDVRDTYKNYNLLLTIF